MGRCIRETDVTDSINVNAGCEQKALRNQRTKEKRKYGLQASRIEGHSSWTLSEAKNSGCCRTEVKERYEQTPHPVHLACLNTVHQFYTQNMFRNNKKNHIHTHTHKAKTKTNPQRKQNKQTSTKQKKNTKTKSKTIQPTNQPTK